MKNLFLLAISLLLLIQAKTSPAQIDTTHGIYPIDSCDFETPCTWILLSNDTTGAWQIGAIQKPGFDSAYSPANAVATDTLEPYPVSISSSCFEIDLNQLPLTGGGIVLSFVHRYDTDSLIDGGYLEISYDDGATWTNVLLGPSWIYFGAENLYAVTDTLAEGDCGFSGSSADWITTRIQWVLYGLTRGANVGLKIRFCFKSDSIQTNKAGWIIDNIKISTTGFWGDIEDANAYHALKIYPNPVVEQLHLQFNPTTVKHYAIAIYDILGQQLTVPLPLLAGNSSLDLSAYPPGVYAIQVRENQQVVAYKRFIKR